MAPDIGTTGEIDLEDKELMSQLEAGMRSEFQDVTSDDARKLRKLLEWFSR
jgi:hypothetical protein